MKVTRLITTPPSNGDHASCPIYPHTHVLLDDKGNRKPCSGRFFCELHQEFFSAPPCHGEVPAPLRRP